MTELRLTFSKGEKCELVETFFSHPFLSEHIRTFRGRNNASRTAASFGWTAAVRALSLLFIKYSASIFLLDDNQAEDGEVHLAGHRSSLASSLDYALSKEPVWLLDMFGVDAEGRSILRRMLIRSNPELKRAGPVKVSINKDFLSANSIKIFVGERQMASADQLLLIAELIDKEQLNTAKNKIQVDLFANTPTQQKFDGEPLSSYLSQSDIYNLFHKKFSEEAAWAFRGWNAFSSQGYKRALNNIIIDPSFGKVCATQDPLNTIVDSSLPTGLALGLIPLGLQNYCRKRQQPLQIGITPAQVAGIAVLKDMQKQGLNLNVDFAFSLGSDFLSQLQDEDSTLDGFVVTIATAASIFTGQKVAYQPMALMPRISHRVLEKAELNTKRAGKLAGKYLMVTDLPSTPGFCLDTLIREKAVAKNQISTECANPSEITRMMLSGKFDAKTILGFPHYFLLGSFSDTRVIEVKDSEWFAKDALLFLKKSLLKDQKLIMGIAAYLRSSWLTLTTQKDSLKTAVDEILHDQNYLLSLGRTCGVHHLDGGFSERQSNQRHG